MDGGKETEETGRGEHCLESNGGRVEMVEDRRHDECKDLCMHYTFRAKQKGRLPTELQESNIGSQSMQSSDHCYSTGCFKIVPTCFKIKKR